MTVFTKPASFLGSQWVDPSPGMGIDQGHGRWLALQVLRHGKHTKVFVDIGKVAGMISMLIGKQSGLHHLSQGLPQGLPFK